MLSLHTCGDNLNPLDPEQHENPTPATDYHSCDDAISPDDRIVEIHVRELNQLFNSLDPSPFRERDLDADAEQYIIDSVKELPSRKPSVLEISIDRPAQNSDEGRMIGQAIRIHFARRSQVLARELRRLIHRGAISLVIGLSFMAAFFLLGQLIPQLFGEHRLTNLVKEGMIIGGWVAMWRPLEIFLYDWWPIVGERRVHDQLSRVNVRVIFGQSSPSPAVSPITPGVEASKQTRRVD